MSALESLIASMTVGELAKLANSTVEKIVGAAFGSRPASSGKSAKRSATNGARRPARAVAVVAVAKKAGGKGGAVARGGVAIKSVLEVVAAAKGPIDINAIRKKIGGSPAQVRAALKKLAEAKKVIISGERRGTRYSVR